MTSSADLAKASWKLEPSAAMVLRMRRRAVPAWLPLTPAFESWPSIAVASSKLTPAEAATGATYFMASPKLDMSSAEVLNDLAMTSVTRPELFTTEEMAGDVETSGELTVGATVFDRRHVPAWRHNMDVAVDMHTEGVTEAVIRGLTEAARRAGR